MKKPGIAVFSVLLAFALLLSACGVAAGEGSADLKALYEEGRDYWQGVNGKAFDREAARERFRAAADGGYADAWFYLGKAALASVDAGKVEAARSMGSSTLGIIFRVYLHEAVPDLIRATTITAISLIGLTTMAGAVGAGGIGSFAINYGQNQNHQDIVNVCVVILLVFVSLLQFLGNLLARRTTNRGLLGKGGKE